jgi:hypothetical protein
MVCDILEAWDVKYAICVLLKSSLRTHPLPLIPEFLSMTSLHFLISRMGSPLESKQINSKVDHVDGKYNRAEGYCNGRRDDWLLVSREDRCGPL